MSLKNLCKANLHYSRRENYWIMVKENLFGCRDNRKNQEEISN